MQYDGMMLQLMMLGTRLQSPHALGTAEGPSVTHDQLNEVIQLQRAQDNSAIVYK